jgi:GNAT superfamily N-acetyltransferase
MLVAPGRGCKRAGVVLQPPAMEPIRLRRGRRTDFAGVQALLPEPARGRERFGRRTLASLAGDVYVAEAPGGEIVGVVAVMYLRSLRAGRFDAVLDAARASGDGTLLDRLIAFAEARARRRGCRRLAACVGPDDGALRAALETRGYGAGALLVADLGEAG